MRWIVVLLMAVTLVSRTPLRAADVPPPLPDLSTFPESVGVNIHFTDPKPGELEQIYAGGFRWVRMDFGWGAIERRKGEYNFEAYDRLVSALESHHIRAIFILDYSNRNYDAGRSPYTDDGRAAFAKWAAASIHHFKGHGILWEMWNEPNGTFWNPRANVDDYAKLAMTVGKALHEAEPAEIYIGPATSTIDMSFLEECFKAGCLQYWSAVSVHPYRQGDPESVAGEYRKLRALIAKYNPTRRKIPIISGEWGYSSVWKGFDDERQAKYLPRELLTNIANEVPVSIWYDWHEDGKDPKEPEHHFGIVLPDPINKPEGLYDPKPAYEAAKRMSALSGMHYCSRLWSGDANDFVLLFSDGAQRTATACWTVTRSPHEIICPMRIGDETKIPLSGAPVYDVTINDHLLQIAATWSRVPLDMKVAGPGMARVETKVRNPLDHSITIVSGKKKTVLEPGETTSIFAEEPISRAETASPLDVVLEIEGLGRLVQRMEVEVSNPLRVVFLPRVGNVQQVRIENPAGGELKAKAMLTGAEPPIAGELKSLEHGSAYSIAFPLDKSHPLDAPAGLLLKDNAGQTLLDIPPAKTSSLEGFDIVHPDTSVRLVVDGDPKAPSEQKLSLADPPDGPPAPGVACLKLEYQFQSGWKFFRLAPKAQMTLPARAKAIGIWVHGDGQGNLLRMRLTDATGQTFQPDGGRTTWTGWRYITIPLDIQNVAHWGGANDGSPHGAIHIDTLLLLDSYNRNPSKGEIFISSPMVTY